MGSADYALVGEHYAALRQADPRIAALIQAQLEDAETIVNIGAGTGSYEPAGKTIVAIEPSQTMLAQRRAKENTTVICASAEQLPLAADTYDAALAILTIHHWNDWRQGLQEARRVARRKLVLLTWIGMPNGFWLFDYFPAIEHLDKDLFPSLEALATELDDIEVTPVPIPADCTDGFLCAYWARPQRYLDARTRSAISTFSRISQQETETGLKKLARDLETGDWHKRYGQDRHEAAFDFGYRLVVAQN